MQKKRGYNYRYCKNGKKKTKKLYANKRKRPTEGSDGDISINSFAKIGPKNKKIKKNKKTQQKTKSPKIRLKPYKISLNTCFILTSPAGVGFCKV